MDSILVSKCLFGENVRYDGGNCRVRADYIARLKNKYNIILVCPEVLAGMTIPRSPIEKQNDRIVTESGDDVSEMFQPVLIEISELVKKHNIKYALLKENSPSCGVHFIYDGTFSGGKIPGQGLVAEHLRKLDVIIKSESEIESLL